MTNKHDIGYAQLRNQQWEATQNELAVWAVLSVVMISGVALGIIQLVKAGL